MNDMWQTMLFAFVISLVVCLVIGPLLIPALQRLKFGQSIRSDGPERHLQKQGTPTMGGVMFFFSLILGTVFLAGDSFMTYFLLVCALGFGLIGFDACCYANNDLERKEVRIELGWDPTAE